MPTTVPTTKKALGGVDLTTRTVLAIPVLVAILRDQRDRRLTDYACRIRMILAAGHGAVASMTPAPLTCAWRLSRLAWQTIRPATAPSFYPHYGWTSLAFSRRQQDGDVLN